MPADSFDSIAMPRPLREAIAARGLTAPTLVQSRVADAGNAGRDLLVSSQTGSGKTLAFGLLIAGVLVPEGGDRVVRGGSPSALVLAPTRELAVQVQRELAWLLTPAGARVVSVTGGSDAREEIRRLRAGCEIVVATPGRLVDHLRRRTTTLAGAKVVVLDEGDEMLRFGFREDLETILDAATGRERTHLFSATLPAPILKLAATYQKDPVRISVGGGDRPAAHQDIEFLAHLHAPGEREAAVVNVLRRHDAPAAIVFTATRAGAARLGADLARRGFSAVTLSGEMTQSERTRALASVREGRAKVLVATDVAARGLDLPDVALVVHADLPTDVSGITHRSGRTGRAGRKGTSVLLAPRTQRLSAERMVRAAGIAARWSPLPTAEEIAALDLVRLTAELAAEAAAPMSADAAARVDRLLDRIPVRELVAALLARVTKTLPAPEAVSQVAAAPPARPAREGAQRPSREGFAGRPTRDGAPRPPSRRPPDGEGAPPRASKRPPREAGPSVFFRVNLGRRQGAEPRTLLPIICRRGGVEGRDVGKISISERSSTFEIAGNVAHGFEQRVAAPDPRDPKVKFMRADAAPPGPAAAAAPAAPRRPGKPIARRPAGYED